MVEYINYKKDDDTSSSNGKKEPRKPIFTLKRIIWGVVGIFILSILISSCVVSISPKIAVVPIKGEITTNSVQTLFQSQVSSRSIANQIYTLADDSTVKAIILDINSPGGSPVASDEISKAVAYARDQKDVYSVISDSGASGAYWVAASSTQIYAAPLSVVGSIGVTSAGLSFEDFIKEYNVSYRRQIAGEFKDMGSPFREQTPEEIEKMQNLLDTIHEAFIEHVAQNRNMSLNETRSLATGEIFLGSRAQELRLVDEIGYIRDVEQDLKDIHGNETLVLEYSSFGQGGLFSVSNPLAGFLGISDNKNKIELK
ncbi:MAG: signal peptide peptidase SppA [Candidatus Nanoarchaeia archaeon]